MHGDIWPNEVYFLKQVQFLFSQHYKFPSQYLQNFKTLDLMAFCDLNTKAQPFSVYGYNGKTLFDKTRSTSNTSNYIYELTFNGLGKVTTVRQKYEIIMGSPLIQHKTNSKEAVYEIHPFFYYLMQKLMKFETLSMLKFTEYNPRVLQQFVKNEDKQKPGASNKIHQTVYALIDELRGKMQHLTKEKGRIYRLQWFSGQMQQAEKACMASYENLVAKGFVQPCLKNFQFKRYEPSVMSKRQQQAVKKLFQQVNAIEPLRESYQSTKLMLFQKKHKNYYHTLLKEREESFLSKILIKRLGTDPELMLNLEEHVRLREQDPKMDGVSVSIIHGLCQELKNYTNLISNESVKYFYQFLEPSNVFIDQMTLRAKISFNPVLLDAMGLKKKPLSFQNQITFFPTPQGFNFFQSLTELDSDNKLILDDPFYGCIQMLGQQKNRLSIEHKKQIYIQQRQNLQKIKQQSMVWRLILTSYYLIRGRQFGKELNNGQPLQKIQKIFKAMLQAKREQFKNDKYKVIEFMLGPALTKRKKQYINESKQFTFNFDQLYTLLGLKQNNDQLIQDLKFKRIKKYHNLRKYLVRSILKVFMAQHIFLKLFNVKKYMIMYSIIANQVMEEAKQMLEVEKKKAGERKHLKESLDKDIRRLKTQKSYRQTLTSTFQKIKRYIDRTDSDQQAKYIQRDEEGIFCYNSILQIYNFINQLASKQQQLNKSQSAIKREDEIQDPRERQKNDKDIKERNEYFSKIYTFLNQKFQSLRHKCRRIFQKCFNSNMPQELHKFEKKSQDSKENHCIYTSQFNLIVKSLYLLNISNFPDYQSLIMSNLNLDQSDKKPQVPNLTKQQRKVKYQKLKLIEQLLKTYEDPLYQKQSQPAQIENDQDIPSYLFYPFQKEANIRKTCQDQQKFKKQNIIWKAPE